jgi:hypothetical protein
MRGMALVLVLLATLILPLAVAEAVSITFVTDLSGANEIPVVLSSGTGHVTAVLDTIAQTLLLNVTFSGLTSPDVAAHIHCCVPQPGNTGVATTLPAFPGFPLNVTFGSYSQVLDLTSAGFYNTSLPNGFVATHGGTVASAEAAFIAGLEGGQTYLNIHTLNFGGGEIRGTLARVPEPSALLLLGVGLAAMGCAECWGPRRK